MSRTPQEMYDDVVKGVQALLKPLGYAKSGQTFRRVGEETTLIVQLPKDKKYTTGDSIPFGINVGVVINSIYGYPGLSPDVRKAVVGTAHVSDSIAPTGRYEWEIDAATDGAALTAEIVEAVRARGLAFLERYSTKAAIVALWRSGGCQGHNDFMRLKYLAQVGAPRETIDQHNLMGDQDAIFAAWRSGDFLGYPEAEAKELLAFYDATIGGHARRR